MTCYHFIIYSFIIFRALFTDIVHSVQPREVSFNLASVDNITFYDVSLHEEEDDVIIFQNPTVLTDIMAIKLDDSIDVERNDDPTERTAVFYRRGVPGVAFTIEFMRPNQAGRFRDFKTVRRGPNTFRSGALTKFVQATNTDAPRIDCKRFENGAKSFQVISERNPDFNFAFNTSEVTITFTDYSEDGIQEELVELGHDCLSKEYHLFFKSIDDREAFVIFFNNWSDE